MTKKAKTQKFNGERQYFVVGCEMANGAGHITSIDTENDINFTLTLFTHSSHAIRDIEDSPDPSEWFVREVRANNIGKWIDKFGVDWSEVAANQANERFC